MKYLLYKNRCRFTLLIIVQLLRNIAVVGAALLLNFLIDTVSASIETGTTRPLVRSMAICVIYALSLGSIIFASEKLKAANIKHTMFHLRKRVKRGILSMDIPEYQEKSGAEFLTLLSQNLSVYEEDFVKNVINIIDSCMCVLFAIGMLLWLNPLIAVISIAAMSVPSLIPKFFGRKLAALQSEIMDNTVSYNATVKDILDGYEVIKTYHMENRMEERHGKKAWELENGKSKLAEIFAWLYGLTNMTSVMVQFLIMALAGFFAVKGYITIGSIVAVTQLTGQVVSPFFQMSALFSRLKSTKPVCQQIDSVISCQSGADKKDIIQMQAHLHLKDVSFSYDGRLALKNVSIDFEHGKKYAITGKSGSGKSTLLKLIAGYLRGYTGKILADGHENPLCDLAFIHQNVFLFNDTIRNNITLFEEFPEERIMEAVRIAGLEDTITALPQGLDAQAGENGAKFSGGEKQRISIARAILHSKNLLLLDEATSALDNDTAIKIEENIAGLKEMTCISVTHRLLPEIMKNYDSVILMNDGKALDICKSGI